MTTGATLQTTSASLGAAASQASACIAPTLTQAFLSFNDSNEYALVPGESNDSFAGIGWTLSGGAKIITTTLQDGTSGSVLVLPSGAKAVSPAMCVTNQYPTARAMVRDVAGSAGVATYVAYLASSSASLVSTGGLNGSGTAWTLSPVLNIDPSSVTGWQLATFTLTAGGTGSEYELYNLYIDPRMKS